MTERMEQHILATYSNTSMIIDKDNSETTSKQKQDVLDFIYQIIRKRCEPEQFIEFLCDGSIIEEVMLRACPTPLGKKLKNKYPKNPTPHERVEKIINDMFEYGVSLQHLFEPEDLLNAINIPKVSIVRIKMFIEKCFRITALQ